MVFEQGLEEYTLPVSIIGKALCVKQSCEIAGGVLKSVYNVVPIKNIIRVEYIIRDDDSIGLLSIHIKDSFSIRIQATELQFEAIKTIIFGEG